MLTAKNITKKYQGKEVLTGITLDIEPGKITTLIGPSGAGKTTLLYTLSFVENPDNGEVIVDETHYTFPVLSGIEPSPSPAIMVVFQQLFLWPHLTLRENIELPLKINNIEFIEQLQELIEAFGMADFIDRYPNETSLGQRQRAALVRAIALNPKYIFLDEVTSALDIEQVEALAVYLQKLKNRGMGIIVVTHLIHFAQRISDNIIFMDKGRIIERGGSDLLSNPKQPRTQEFLKYF